MSADGPPCIECDRMTDHLTSIWLRATLLVVLALGTGCSASTTANRAGAAASEKAILWTMRSAEYRAATMGIFTAAAAALPALLADEAWTAALEQDSAIARGKPPAIVVDIDETMLSNSRYQWELAASGAPFDEQSWDAWIQRRDAGAVPGAVEFVRRVSALNATVFYVSNRTCRPRGAGEACPQAEDTLENLAAAGFPKPRAEQLLLESMRPDWSEDKSSRRSHLSANYRIVELVGDDLGDFIPSARTATEARRNQLMAEYRSRWGNGWFLLPNPMYGSWERALRARESTQRASPRTQSPDHRSCPRPPRARGMAESKTAGLGAPALGTKRLQSLTGLPSRI